MKEHPDSELLYVESIDVGEEIPRTILSGIAKYKTIDQVRDQLVVVLKNLKPRRFVAGIGSRVFRIAVY